MVKPEGTLNIGFTELGPFGNSPRITPGQTILYHATTAGETFLKLDIDQKTVPQLVTEWGVDDGGTVWTFKLQEGVQFHKGWGEMTAEDIVYSMQELAADDSVGAFQGTYKRLFGPDGSGVAAVDDYTVTVDTVTPQFDFLINMSAQGHAVVSKKNFVDEGGEVAQFQGVGTGP